MWAWLNDIDKLSSANSKLLFASAFLAVLAALFGFAAYATGDKLARMQDARRIANEATIADALHKTSVIQQQNLALKLAVEQEHNAGLELKKQLDSADASLADIQAQRAPRLITPEMRAEMLPKLRSFAGAKVRMWLQTQDNETKDFGNQVFTLMRDAGWQVDAHGGMGAFSGPASGVVAYVAAASAVPPHVRILLSELRKYHIAIFIHEDGQMSPDDSLLVINSKPK